LNDVSVKRVTAFDLLANLSSDPCSDEFDFSIRPKTYPLNQITRRSILSWGAHPLVPPKKINSNSQYQIKVAVWLASFEQKGIFHHFSSHTNMHTIRTQLTL